jgi:hypothetical protein
MDDESSARFMTWVQAHRLDMTRFSTDQRVLVCAALRFLEFAEHQRLLVRFVTYFLTHCGVPLSASNVGRVVGRSSRAVEETKAVSVEDFVRAAHRDGDRHGGPTLEPVHAGPVAQFIFEHPGCTHDDIAAFAAERLGVVVGIDGVRAFLRRHGLIDLKNKEPAAPLF